MFEANKAETACRNLDLLVLKTCLSAFDQSKTMKVNVAGIHSCSVLIACMQDDQHYKGFPLDKMLHMRSILYSRCAIFKQVCIDIKNAVKKLHLHGGTDAEMEADHAMWMDPIHKSKTAICRECGKPAQRPADVVTVLSTAARHAKIRTSARTTKVDARIIKPALV